MLYTQYGTTILLLLHVLLTRQPCYSNHVWLTASGTQKYNVHYVSCMSSKFTEFCVWKTSFHKSGHICSGFMLL